MDSQKKNGKQKEKAVDAIELAILNGIEAYNREQAQKQKNGAQGAQKTAKNIGQERTAEAMQEAGYAPRRPSRAKGKGTRIATAELSTPKQEKPPREKTEKRAPAQGGGKKRGAKKQPVKVLFLGGVGEIGKNMTALEFGNDIIVIDAGISFPTEEMPGIDLVFPDRKSVV